MYSTSAEAKGSSSGRRIPRPIRIHVRGAAEARPRRHQEQDRAAEADGRDLYELEPKSGSTSRTRREVSRVAAALEADHASCSKAESSRRISSTLAQDERVKDVDAVCFAPASVRFFLYYDA